MMLHFQYFKIRLLKINRTDKSKKIRKTNKLTLMFKVIDPPLIWIKFKNSSCIKIVHENFKFNLLMDRMCHLQR